MKKFNYGRHAAECIRRIKRVGVDAFLEQEMGKPSIDDGPWSKFILGWWLEREHEPKAPAGNVTNIPDGELPF